MYRSAIFRKTSGIFRASVGTNVPIVIEGRYNVGQVLTVEVSSGFTVQTVQWVKKLNTTVTNISGATGLTYTIQAGDLGYTVYPIVTGYFNNTLREIVATPVAPTVVTNPVITKAAQGSLVEFTPATFAGTPTPNVSNEWFVNGTSVGSITPIASIVGSQILLAQRASNSAGQVTAYSSVVTVSSQQTVTPFTVGTVDFAVASLDAYVYNTSTQQLYAERMWSDDGKTVDVICDGVSGSNIGAWQANILPVILARAGTPDMVVVLSNPLGNDTTEAVSLYGRADAAPANYWESRISVLASGVAQLKAAGFTVIVGNNSYRNYGLDDSCRTDEDKGSHYVNRAYLEPWIKTNMPECWNSAADQPMLNPYNYIWNLGNWFFSDADQTHPNTMGIQALRRYNHEVVSRMAAGIIPPAIAKRSWPDAGVATIDTPRTVVAFGGASTLSLLPANINKASISVNSTTNTYITFPVSMIGHSGQQSPVKMHSFGWYSFNATGRGNAGDSTVSLTNDALLKGAAGLGSSSSNNRGFLEIGGLTPFGKYKVRLAASASTGSQVKTSWNYVNSFTEYQVCEPKTSTPDGYMEFDAIADSVGFIHVLVLTASGSVASYLSGLEIESRI